MEVVVHGKSSLCFFLLVSKCSQYTFHIVTNSVLWKGSHLNPLKQ
jgi:hypothetical protein